MEVIINGIKYVPARSIADSMGARKFMEKLIEECWGANWQEVFSFEDALKELSLTVTDSPSKYDTSLSDFYENLFEKDE